MIKVEAHTEEAVNGNTAKSAPILLRVLQREGKPRELQLITSTSELVDT